MVYQIAFWASWTCAGVANAFVDWFGFEKNDDEWRSKYAYPLEYAPKTLYYKLNGLPFKEKFFLSGTILCFLTNKFHFYQFLQTTFLITALTIGLFLPANYSQAWFPLLLVVSWGLITHVAQIRVRKHFLK